MKRRPSKHDVAKQEAKRAVIYMLAGMVLWSFMELMFQLPDLRRYVRLERM